jgi:diguanylate cyclase (GGDEF)-like protein
MLSNLGLSPLGDPSLPAFVTVGGLWLLSFGGVGLWCRHLSGRLTALACVSTLDPLTGLGNGRLFESERWPSALRASGPLAVLYIDLDHLKQSNARYRRVAGDRYIAGAATVLRSGCRRGVDEIFRLHTAGDEFTVLVRGPEAQQAETIAENILGRLRAEGISASVGAAWTLATDHRERATLLHVAEQAMHEAKASGKGRARITAVPNEPTGEPSEAIPEPIAEEWTNPRRTFGPRDQAAVVLHRVRDDVRLAFPAHRISLAIADNLPPLTVDEGRFTLAVATLLLHVASISRHVHITAGMGTRVGLVPDSPGDTTPMLRVCVEFTADKSTAQPSLINVCNRVCVQEGGAWTMQTNCICLAWPVAPDSRPSQPTLRLVAGDAALPASSAGGAP